MNKILITIILASVAFGATAADWITATVHVSTNAPLGNTNSITINGDTRTFTNTVTGSPATLIQETNSVFYTATNVLSHLTSYKVNPGYYLSQTSSTNVTIRGLVGGAMVVTLGGFWGHVTYSTQTVQTPTIVVRVPISNEAATNRVTIANELVNAVDDYATELFGTNSPSLVNYLSKGASPLQNVSAPVLFSGGASGVIGSVTNGYSTNMVLQSPKTTNLVNYGNAIRSEGSGGNSFQSGSNALATGARAIAIGANSAASDSDALAVGVSSVASGNASLSFGNNATASGIASLAVGKNATASFANASAVGVSASASEINATAFGNSASASATNATAVGVGPVASGFNSIAVGDGNTQATEINSIAIGPGSSAVFQDSIAIGVYDSGTAEIAATTATNQIRLGQSRTTVSVPGMLEAASQTNSTLRGTNVLNGRIDLTAGTHTALANGYNSGVVVGTNAYRQFSGPSGAYTNAGFAAPGGPQFAVLQFDNPGLSFTLLNESGLDATAANRILTGTGALLNSTNNPVIAQLIYDMAASRWRVISFR